MPPRPPDANVGPDGTWADAAPPVDSSPTTDVVMDPDGPTSVMVVYPTDTVELIGDRHTFTCHAEPNVQSGSPVVDVTFFLKDRSAGSPRQFIAQPVGNDDYTALVDLSGFQNGTIDVQCVATGADGHMNGDETNPKLDLGPRIVVVRPSSGSFVHGNIQIDFTVTPDPIKSPDDMDDVAPGGVSTRIAGTPITVAQDGSHYTATIGTADPAVFDPPLVGPAQFLVRATNLRGAVRQVIVPFTVDDTGPTIVITDPVPGQLVGGVITVKATIVDDAGVDATSVVAVFGNGPVDIAEFDLSATGTPGQFEGTYDSRELREALAELPVPIDLVFPTLSVRAKDLVGNQGNVGEVVVLDYMPPLVSMDPPMMREAKEDRLDGTIECSREFDPLGDDAVNDGQEVSQLFELRARIEDRGNFASTTSSIPAFAAGIDVSTAQLLILGNVDETIGAGDALIVDTNGDQICDDVNPLIMPRILPMGPLGTDEALAINLIGVTPRGEFFYQAEDPICDAMGVCDPIAPYLPDYPLCDPPDESMVPPPRLCPFTGLQRVLAPEFTSEPVIFTIPPVIDDYSCLGLPVDAGNYLPDGWVCAVVRVQDNLGNIGISQPLRICIDKDNDNADGCPGDPTYPINVDQTDDETDVPIVPIDNGRIDPSSPTYIDCTGTYVAPDMVFPADDCQVPDWFFEFPAAEMRMRRT